MKCRKSRRSGWPCSTKRSVGGRSHRARARCRRSRFRTHPIAPHHGTPAEAARTAGSRRPALTTALASSTRPSDDDLYRSSDRKFVSSPAALKSSSARTEWPALVSVALTVRSSIASHSIRGVDQRCRRHDAHVVQQRDRLRLRHLGAGQRRPPGAMPATCTSIEADPPTYR